MVMENNEKDDIFFISMTELLLIIMFALLIVMVILNSSLQEKNKASKEEIQTAIKLVTTLDNIAQQLGLPEVESNSSEEKDSAQDITHQSTPELIEVLSQIQALVKALDVTVNSDEAKEVLARMDLEEVWTTLAPLSIESIDLESIIEKLREIQQKANQLDALNQELRDEKEKVSKENNNLKGQIEHLSAKGLELPPCWATETGKPEYTFQVTVHDEHLRVETIFPEHRYIQYTNLVTEDYNGMAFGHDDFKREMYIFYKHARESVPECRYFVKVADETSAASKKEYKTGLSAIESVFYKFLMGAY